jgi:hypothetical protein
VKPELTPQQRFWIVVKGIIQRYKKDSPSFLKLPEEHTSDIDLMVIFTQAVVFSEFFPIPIMQSRKQVIIIHRLLRSKSSFWRAEKGTTLAKEYIFLNGSTLAKAFAGPEGWESEEISFNTTVDNFVPRLISHGIDASHLNLVMSMYTTPPRSGF